MTNPNLKEMQEYAVKYWKANRESQTGDPNTIPLWALLIVMCEVARRLPPPLDDTE